ncbi:hypothetical protein CEXT_253511 [Caerostris extrusa]|uniref:Uncharacterized protein n=1 Tax=Caerostris extrusa TaxID=172846 RepID=A0AAV4MS23_CAEEX|nr:hypothetical protein CEXT_253511 [Caerostris extrusa]
MSQIQNDPADTPVSLTDQCVFGLASNKTSGQRNALGNQMSQHNNVQLQKLNILEYLKRMKCRPPFISRQKVFCYTYLNTQTALFWDWKKQQHRTSLCMGIFISVTYSSEGQTVCTFLTQLLQTRVVQPARYSEDKDYEFSHVNSTEESDIPSEIREDNQLHTTKIEQHS